MLTKFLCLVLVCSVVTAYHKKRSHALLDVLRDLLARDQDPAVASDFCKGKTHGGIYTDPERCNGFIQCVFGTPYAKDCAAGSFFNPRTSTCDQLTCTQNTGTVPQGAGFSRATCTSAPGDVQIKMEIEQYSTQTLVYGTVTGLTPGKHGFHIHEFGDLSNGCGSTGGHYNPLDSTHGSLTASTRHVGDMGNIDADATGKATVDLRSEGSSRILLDGETSVFARAIVVHAGQDDVGQGGNDGSRATGNAGGRVVCCIIGRAFLDSYVKK